MGEQLGEFRDRGFAQVHAQVWPTADFGSGTVAGVNDAPDASTFAVDAFGICLSVLVARIFIAPIGDPERAIGTDLFAHWPKPFVFGGHEISLWIGREAG